MRAIPEFEGTSLFSSAGAHIGDDIAHLVHRVRPHQVDIGSLRRSIASDGRQTTEIERRTFARQRRHPRRREVESVELTLELKVLTVQHGLEDIHRLNSALIAGNAVHHFTRQIRRDDVDSQPPAQNAVECRNPPRQLRRPVFANADGHQQTDLPDQRRNGGREHGRIHAQRITGRQQDVIIAAFVSGQHDIAAMLPGRSERRIGLAKELIVIIAQRGKPAHFALLGSHGSFSPRAATSTAYQSVRVQLSL
jgi:hypothetical protein